MIAATIPTDALREVAENNGVCTRPVVHQVTDTVTNQVSIVATRCGATLESKCVPCARRNRKLRMQQCREGWHLEEEPACETDPSGEADAEEAEDTGVPDRRGRSTRRRQDAPDLPRLPVEDRTVGTAFTTPSGRTYRPSMFVTFTLPSYGRVRTDGSPVDPRSYDYRRAALDALHFPKLVDRVWQNLRRATGYKVQYFASVEAQRRLAPHLHAAIRGAIPRQLFRQVARATYHQVWWPAHDEPLFTDAFPEWVEEVGYVDPASREPLPTWDEALDDIDEDQEAEPAHVIRFGRELDIQGIIATEGDADRRVAYLTKYLAKSFGASFGASEELNRRQRAHQRRLHDEVRFLPCAPRCWNWLRFGIQPQHAGPGMSPGACPAKCHDEEHLGCGGRRVLVSRRWSGKTLDRHRADRAEVVRQTLLAAGVEVPDSQRLAADVLRSDGRPRYAWEFFDPRQSPTPLYRQVLARSLAEHLRWKAEYEAAKARASPANAPPRPPDSQPTSFGVAPVRGERSESRSDTKCP
ncbi:replication initiator [Nocardioides guangzhouensis]|uniref:replication initiator n=1 Tax=Nocardioides guangzhouensis TaxID=2497878 RepID=UPI001589BC0F|nr:replication initiator [Nocardioides guangzhouensis]